MRSILPSLFAIALTLSACSSSQDGELDCKGEKCDAFDSAELAECQSDADFETGDGSLGCTPCSDVLRDESGRGFLPAILANDALVKKVYMTFEDADGNGRIDSAEIDCPRELPSIMAKLEKTDKQNCRGLSTHVVSESAAHVGKDGADYRAVTTRDCDGRGAHGLLFSTFGFTGPDNGAETGADQNGAPGQVEIIAFDEVEGVFNYYKEVGGQMRFFGSSLDFVVAGPGGPELTSIRGCANCHPGGGINMKELRSPWTHWAQNDNIQGADDLVRNRAEYLGTLGAGSTLEGIVESGNREWNKTKVEFFRNVTTAELESVRGGFADGPLSPSEESDLIARGLRKRLNATQELLRPVFCPVQINIRGFGARNIPSSLLAVDGNGLSPNFISTAQAQFDAAIAAIGSNLPGLDVPETTTPFMAAHLSGEDANYINQLIQQGILDTALVQDILMVDFTRGLLSDDRCALLELVPDVDPADRNAAGLKAALIESLAGSAAGTPPGELLANLQTDGVNPIFEEFKTTCRARDVAEVLRDALKIRSLQRKLMFADGVLDFADGPAQHRFSVFEFQQTMPVDDIAVTELAAPDSIDSVHPDARFDPRDCTLTTGFVPVTQEPEN